MMELRDYIQPLLKWWWLIVIATLAAAISSFLVTRQQPAVYQASTALVIGRSVYDPNPTSNDFWLGQQLAGYYADIAQRDHVREATKKKLGIDWLPEYSVRPLPNNQIIEIIVKDISPLRAQAVANELAKQLIEQSPSSPQFQDQERQDFISQQLLHLEEKIEETENEIVEKQQELADMISARQIADTQQEINALETKLTTLQSNFATLLASSGQGANNSLTVLESATLPTTPVGPNKNMIILLSSGIGFLLASGAAYLLEYLDDTFRSTEDISKVIQSPVIGMIPYTKMWKGNKTYIADQPGSAEAEAFRLLRTNIEFFGIDHDLTTILVTSPDTGDGKTSVAINLAITMAQAGKRVILMDADMRKPNIHKIFEITDAKGLSDLFVNDLELEIIITTWEAGEIVGIITAGKSPPNPAELLASKRMDQILSALKEKADVIIIDSPPLFITDGIILSKKVDGVLVVLRHGFTRKNTVIAAFEQLQRAQARTLGIVFNKIPRMMDGYDAGYRYYSKYYLSRNGKGSSKLKKKTGAKKRSGLLGKMKETLNDTSINPSQEI